MGKYWTSDELSLLGTMTDRELSEKLGRSVNCVMKARQNLKIKPCKRFEWTQQALDMLGKVADQEVANLIGCSRPVVANKRKELGIPKCRTRRTFKRKKQKKFDEKFSWVFLKELEQPIFFNLIKEELSDYLERKATYIDIARITLYSLSRVQKWATPGTAQEPLAITVRHHIWASTSMVVLGYIKTE